MPPTTYFVKECPTCGRKLQVRVEYMGQEMVCNHCGGDFIAGEANERQLTGDQDSGECIIARVDDLISKSENQFGKPR